PSPVRGTMQYPMIAATVIVPIPEIDLGTPKIKFGPTGIYKTGTNIQGVTQVGSRTDCLIKLRIRFYNRRDVLDISRIHSRDQLVWCEAVDAQHRHKHLSIGSWDMVYRESRVGSCDLAYSIIPLSLCYHSIITCALKQSSRSGSDVCNSIELVLCALLD